MWSYLERESNIKFFTMKRMVKMEKTYFWTFSVFGLYKQIGARDNYFKVVFLAFTKK